MAHKEPESGTRVTAVEIHDRLHRSRGAGKCHRWRAARRSLNYGQVAAEKKDEKETQEGRDRKPAGEKKAEEADLRAW